MTLKAVPEYPKGWQSKGFMGKDKDKQTLKCLQLFDNSRMFR